MDKLIVALLICMIYFVMLFLVGVRCNNHSIVDVAWGPGFIIVCLCMIIYDQSTIFVNYLQLFLISLWGLRLAYHIYRRNKGKHEDYRYRNFRKKWGNHPLIGAFFQVYMLQALFMWIISFTFLFVENDDIINMDGVMLGMYLWLIGYLFESIADAQLKRFIQNPQHQGKVIETGLWKYSRHPNYFGEALMWWAIAFISFSDNGHALSFIGSVWITISLLFISGIPMLEKRNEKKEGYADYKRRTSIFIPWFPKE